MALIVWLTIAVCGILVGTGLGISKILLPLALQPYRPWLAPWFGLALLATVGGIFGAFGAGADLWAWIGLTGGLCATAWTLRWKEPERPRACRREHALLALVFVLSLIVSLYPVLKEGRATTTSLDNCDPVGYAVIADHMRVHGYRPPPTVDPERPMTGLVNAVLEHGPVLGAGLILAAMETLLRVEAYQVFSILLAVSAASFVPLLWILWRREGLGAITAGGLALMALPIIFNRNMIFVAEQGFAGQVMGEGLLVCLFLLLLDMDSAGPRHLVAAALVLHGTVVVYPILLVLIGAALGGFAGFALICDRPSGIRSVGRLTIVLLIAVAVNPISWRNAGVAILLQTGARVGFDLPRYMWPIEWFGYWSVFSHPLPRVALGASTAILVALFLFGMARSRTPLFHLAFGGVSLGVVLHQVFLAHYSYGHFKAITYVAPILYLPVAGGLLATLEWLIATRRGAMLLILAVAACGIGGARHAESQLFHFLRKDRLAVTLDLAELREVPIPPERRIHLADSQYWFVLWTSYFLREHPLTIGRPNAFLQGIPVRRSVPIGDLVCRRDGERADVLEDASDLEAPLWSNGTFRIGRLRSSGALTLGEGWYELEVAGSDAFRWMGRDATVRVEPSSTERLLAIEAQGALPGGMFAVDVLADGSLQSTLELRDRRRVAIGPIAGNVRCLTFHSRTLPVHLGGDPRDLTARFFAIDLVEAPKGP